MEKARYVPLLIIISSIVAVGLIVFYILSIVFMWGEPYYEGETISVFRTKKADNVLSFTGGEISVDEMILSDDNVKSQDFSIYYYDNYLERKNWEEFEAVINYTSGDVMVCIPFSEGAETLAKEKFIDYNDRTEEQVNKTNVIYSHYIDNENDLYNYSAGFTCSNMKYYICSQNEVLLEKTVASILNVVPN